MWPLQPRQHKNGHLWRRLLVISCLLHAVIMVLLFYAYRGALMQYHVRIGSCPLVSVRDVVFVPLAKSIKPSGHVSKKGSASTSSKTAKKKVAQSPAKPAASMSNALPKKVKAPEKKKQAKPVEQKKKNDLVKKEKEVVKKVTSEKKQDAVVPPAEEKKIDEKKATEQPIVQKELDKTVSATNEQIMPETGESLLPMSADSDIVYIGQAERDAVYLQMIIKQEVEHAWRPPAGLAPELECDIQLIIDWDGKAGDVNVLRSSGVLVYDISVRAALKEVVFSPALRGKQFCMNFKQ